jgi:STAS-like domain of unknown function (DUF4325)
MAQKAVTVSQLIGNYGITLDDGDILYNVLYPSLQEGQSVTVDFQGVAIFASPFFNAAIGRLLANFSADFLKENLKPINLSAAGEATLRQVIKNASAYYSNPVTRAAVDRVLHEQSIAV